MSSFSPFGFSPFKENSTNKSDDQPGGLVSDHFSGRFADPQSAAQRRVFLARATGLKLFPIGAAMSFGAGTLEFFSHNYLVVLANLILFTGCLISWSWTKNCVRFRDHEIAFLPSYACFWLSSIPILYQTGGLVSPYLAGYLVLYILIALVIQTRLKARTLFLFSLANLAGWSLLATFGIQRSFHETIGRSALNEALMLAGAFGCVWAVVHSEDELSKEASRSHSQLAETRDRLSHAARIAEVGNLLAAMIHEIAQPVQVITTAASMINRLRREGRLQDGNIDTLNSKISESTARITRLVTQIRDFSRRGGYEPKLFDLRSAVRSVEALVQYDFRGTKIALETRLPQTPVEVYGDVMEIQQVLLNLINNARDACEGSPNLKVKVKLLDMRSWVRITVIHHGPGIPLAVQQRLFEPYFTTKEKGKGTGLGLSICSELVDRHQGRIFFYSDDKETGFCVDLPHLVEAKLQERAANDSKSDVNVPARFA